MRTIGLTLRTIGSLWLIAVLVIGLAAAPLFGARAAAEAPQRLQQEFSHAAAEFGVPVNVLLSIGYNQSRWEQQNGQSVDGGYGIMNLTTQPPQEDGKGDGKLRPLQKPTGDMTLDMAAATLGEPPARLKSDSQQNIRGAAAVLAQYAKRLNGNQLPAASDTASWYAATAWYGGARDTLQAQQFADGVYGTIRAGQQMTTSQGQQVRLTADPAAGPAMQKMAMVPRTPKRIQKTHRYTATTTRLTGRKI